MNKMEQMNIETLNYHFKRGTLDKVVFNDKSKVTFNGLTFLVDSVDTAKGIVGLKVIDYYVNADRIDWEKTSLLVNKVNKVNDTIPEEDKDTEVTEKLKTTSNKAVINKITDDIQIFWKNKDIILTSGSKAAICEIDKAPHTGDAIYRTKEGTAFFNCDIDFEATLKLTNYVAIVRNPPEIQFIREGEHMDSKAEILYQIELEPLEFGNATLTIPPTSGDPTKLHDKIKWLELACELHMIEHRTIYDMQAISNDYDRHIEKQRKEGHKRLKASYDEVVAENERYKKMVDLLMEKPVKNGGIGLCG